MAIFNSNFTGLGCAKWALGFCLFVLAFIPLNSLGGEMPCKPAPPYTAPEYHPSPPLNTQNSKLGLIDNEDGTITDPKTGLMWVQKDSYADLNMCLNWVDSEKYVHNLKVGGYTDWRIPTIKELVSIFDLSQANVLAWDRDPDYPLALDKSFTEGAAYWYWSSDCGTTAFTECCAKTLYFVNGMVHLRRFELCNNGGVRAVRDVK